MHDYLDEEQRKTVEALVEFNRICEKHHIQYYLIAGSTLGAVRHQGMIPWDDDIDIGVLYEDWYKLKEIIPNELNKDFTYINNDIDKNFPRMFAKILYQGRNCVDIWILVKWTSNPLIGAMHWQIKRMAVSGYKLAMHYTTPHKKNVTWKQKIRREVADGCRRLVYWCLRPFMGRDEYVKLARWSERYFENKNVGCYVSLYSVYPMKRVLIKKEWVETISYVEFEGNQYPTFGDVHAYLTHLYGDYMTPPPSKLRNKEHQEIFGHTEKKE